jgi:hypothetical protein
MRKEKSYSEFRQKPTKLFVGFFMHFSIRAYF